MKKLKRRIPEFKSIQEEARFWDTHNITDYWDEMEDIKLEFIDDSNKEETVTLRMQSKMKSQLEKVAANKGLSISSLLRMWAIENLRKLSR